MASEALKYRPLTSKAFTEAMIAGYDKRLNDEKNQNELEKIKSRRRFAESEQIYLKGQNIEAARAKKHSFIESVRTTFLSEAIFKIYSEATRDDLKNDPISRTIMRSLVSNFIVENGTQDILRKMRTGSNTLSEIYNAVQGATKRIAESIDMNADEMIVTKDMKDNFFDSLDYTDTESISDKIRDRVADAVTDFVDTNAKERENIAQTLASASEKIDAMKQDGKIEGDDDPVAESYNMIAKSRVNTIRSGKKNVFHNLVTTMAESVIKNKDMHVEFMSEGKLDMNKIVDRIELMYTFMETVNTSRIIKIDENFIIETIEEMKK